MNAVATTNARSVSWSSNFAWLIKRELWEHRALYIAPLVVAGVILLGVITALTQAGHIQVGGLQFDSPGERIPDGVRLMVFTMFSIPFFIVMSIVALYYSLDALYADRRDRSVLFWKSLPVSDWEAILSKVFVAVVVAPAISAFVSVLTLFVVLFVFSTYLAFNGGSFEYLWGQIPFVQNVALLIYLLAINVFWFLPGVAWCLLASAWARRSPFLWAIAPVAAIGYVEYQIFGTHEFLQLLSADRGVEMALSTQSLEQAAKASSDGPPLTILDLMTPGNFFSSVDFWGGMAAAAALLAATVWVRRYRETA
jgi:ABC-2 type transport system permease protein